MHEMHDSTLVKLFKVSNFLIKNLYSIDKNMLGSARVSRELSVEEKDLVDRSAKKITGEGDHAFTGDSS